MVLRRGQVPLEDHSCESVSSLQPSSCIYGLEIHDWKNENDQLGHAIRWYIVSLGLWSGAHHTEDGLLPPQFVLSSTVWVLQAKLNSGSYSSQLQYNCLSRFARAAIGARSGAAVCPPPTAFKDGSAAFFYNSTSYWDDLLWAAGWMFKATGDCYEYPVLACCKECTWTLSCDLQGNACLSWTIP